MAVATQDPQAGAIAPSVGGRTSPVASLGMMMRVGWRTHRAMFVIWTGCNVGVLLLTALSIASLYDTPAKIQTYADAIAGGSLYAINGRVEGIDTLGGVIQDEFTFVSSFLAPLLGLVLVARLTRAEEESGRLELLMARQVERRAAPLAAIALTGLVLIVNTVGMGLAMLAAGVPVGRGFLYAGSMTATSFFFAGVAVVAAQLVRHTRGVYMIGFTVVLAAYLLRGVGDVSDNRVVWLSPLGWMEKVAAFGPIRAWALLIPLVLGSLLVGTAVVLADRRDLGSSMWGGRPGPASASAVLRRPLGTAWALQRPSIVGWMIGGSAFAGMFGALANETVKAMADNPSLAEALGATGPPENGFLAMVLLYVAVIGGIYATQAVAALGREERAGHLEVMLARPIGRTRWLAANVAIVALGLVAVVGTSVLVFSVAAALSVGDRGRMAGLIGDGFSYLPSVLLIGSIALAVFGVLPRRFAAAWVVVATTATIAFLGPGLDLDQWLLDLAPTTHVGFPPAEPVGTVGLVVMSGLSVLAGVVAFVGFRRRDIPQG